MEFTREMLIDQLHLFKSFCVAYYEAHLHKKFQKIKKIIAFTATCPKSQNSIYGIHSPLGVKSYLNDPFKFLEV
jgi:hypothetical protein